MRNGSIYVIASILLLSVCVKLIFGHHGNRLFANSISSSEMML